MTKAMAAIIRDMSEELNSLKARKEEIKKKALEHRDTFTDQEQADTRAAIKEINDKIKEKEERLAELRSEAEKNEKGVENMDNTLLHYSENMSRADLFETVEYRSAFFKKLQKKPLTEVETRAITSAANSGGAAIPTVTMTTILDRVRNTPGILSLITIEEIPSLTSFPVANTVADASWISETSASTSSSDTLNNVTLAAYKLIKTIEITAQLETMSVDAFERWLVNTLVKKMTLALRKAVFSGTGSNQPTGLSGMTWDTTNSITVAASANITYDNMVDVEALVDGDFDAEAVWVMNKKTKAQVLKIKDEQKRPIFERAIEKGIAGYILNRPLHIDSQVPDNEIYIGDFKSGYVMNFAKPIEVTSSTEAGFMSGSTIYRGLALVDGKPTNAKGAIAKIKKSST